MSTPIEVATAAVVGLAVFIGLVIHFEFQPVWWWPLVGSEWRAERRQPIPAAQDDAWHELVRLGQELDVRIEPEPRCAECGHVLAGGEHADWCGTARIVEPLTADEWEQLDPDTAAATLIAEWHAPEAEYRPDTGQMALLDDLHVLAWDAGRQLQMLRAGVEEWRASTAGPLLAWYQDVLDQRRRAA